MTEYQIKLNGKVWDYVILQQHFTDEAAKEFLVKEGYNANIEVTQYFDVTSGEY